MGNRSDGDIDCFSFYCIGILFHKMKIQNILFIIGALIAIILILWYLLGSSPTIDQVLVGLVVANLTFSFKIYGDLQKHLGEHERKNP